MEVETQTPICSTCRNPERRSAVDGRTLCCVAARQRVRYASNRLGYREVNRVYREGHRQQILSQKREYYRKNWAKLVLKQARIRAAKKGIPFKIDEGDINIPDVCPVLGIRLELSSGAPGDNSPSVDRIIPSLGYIPGNVLVISYRANRVKSDGSAEEHERIAAWLRARGT